MKYGDMALDNINVTSEIRIFWTTDASNGTTGWSSETTVDINVSEVQFNTCRYLPYKL